MFEAKASLVASDGRILRTETGSEFSAAIAKLNIEPDPSLWVWLLSSNSDPSESALSALLEAASKASELTGLIGPKLVDPTNPKLITQLGLTLTPMGAAFSPVSGVLDQGQHDRAGDVMAVGLEGALVRTTVLSQIGNLNDDVPELARDIDFSVRARLAGFRVVVEPKARVEWAGKASELGRKMKRELRKAQIHMQLAYSPIWFAIPLWLVLLPLGVLRAVGRVAQKRPNQIGSELVGAVWGFFTAKSRFGSRVHGNLKSLKPLRASWNQVRLQSRANADAAEAEQNLAAFSRGLVGSESSKTFTQSHGWLFAFVLLVASWQLFPTSLSISGGGALPISPSLADLFARAGASWQPIANGYFAPSDPFNWVLLLLGSLTFWAPQFSIGLLLFIARPIAFIGAWRVVGLFTTKAWVRNCTALVYALWPALNIALGGARIPEVVAAVTLPWLVLAIARAAGVGRVGSSRSNSQTWSWVAIAGLLLAIEGASAPILLPLVLVGLAVVAFMRIKRFGYLFWIPLPLGAIFAPYAFYLITKAGKPLAVFANPGVDTQAPTFENLELILGGSVLTGLVAVVALLALLTRRWVLALGLWSFAIMLLAASWLVQHIKFATTGSPLALLFAASLVTVVLAAITLDALTAKAIPRTIAALTVIAGVLPLGYLAVTQQLSFTRTDGRVVPWLLAAQAESDAQVLKLSVVEGGYEAAWLPIRGEHFEDHNMAYRFELSKQSQTPAYLKLAELAGNLVSANGVEITDSLRELKLQYVLVPVDNTSKALELGSALDSVPELESAGVTEFGRLWRVKDAKPLGHTEHSVWSITKSIQVVILALFALLAIPSRGVKTARDSEIFVDGEESDA